MPTRENVREAIQGFAHTELSLAAMNLWETLGYRSDKLLDLPSDPEAACLAIEKASNRSISRANAQVSEWKAAHFLFQLTNDEIPSLSYGQMAMIIGENDYQKGAIESFVFLAIELAEGNWTRTQLAKITRELNRAFPMPVIVLFKHNAQFSIAVIDRRANKRDANKDVIDTRRIAIIKDVVFASPHRAHIEILFDLAFPNLGEKHAPTNFRELYDAWIKTLSVQELNKKFYDELLTWYLWAVKKTTFPKGQPLDTADQPSIAVIRLLTRLIFVWFIREKNLVPDALFDATELNALLKEPPAQYPDSSSYYKAILQNLFFATLNTEMKDRQWKAEGTKKFNTDYLNSFVYRYRDQITDAVRVFELLKNIPYLNGGLFKCLDRPVTEKELAKNSGIQTIAVKEGNGLVLRIDGFSDLSGDSIRVPNRLFFSEGEDVDLNHELGTNNKPRTARGLIEIFSRYKFTIEENTPIEEEVALDPELLGKVFENLLASYNEDTKTTARKLSGSFYTPRVVVDYMVDEALITYFTTRLQHQGSIQGLETRLGGLLAFGSQSHDFTEVEVETLTSAIEDLKALDLACGSGAFLMGMLQKLVHVLSKLDPDNHLWKVQNRAPLERQLIEAQSIPDPMLRETRLEEAQEALAKLDIAFSEKHYADYSRKLYLIEKCLFGVDKQPIAIHIAKLRFFISLIVNQKVDRDAENANITALPNLDTKLVAADSLIPIDRPIQTTLIDTRVGPIEEELRQANRRHFASRKYNATRKSQDLIIELRERLADLLEEDHILTKDSVRQVVKWNPFDQNAHADFFDSEWMFGLKEGFDVVIGNPPYVRHENIQDQKPALKKIYDCYAGTADLYVYFYERSIRLLKPNGAFAFITSNKWYRTGYGRKLREWMNQNTLLRRIIDFGDEDVFEALAYPTIVIAKRRLQAVKEPRKDDTIQALNWEDGMPVETFPDVFAEHSFHVPQSALKSEGWYLAMPLNRELLARIRAAGKPLGEWCRGRMYYGIKTGLNDAFVIPGVERARLIQADPNSEEIIKPFLRGKDIKQWRIAPDDQWLIKIESSENKKHPWSDLQPNNAERKFAEIYPEVFKRFDSMREGLIKRQDKGRFFWELRSCAYWAEFEEPKIVLGRFMDKPLYAFDECGFYTNNALSIIAGATPFLACVLNSSVNWWFLQSTCTDLQGGFLQAHNNNQTPIPIPNASESQMSLLDLLGRALTMNTLSEQPQFEQLVNGLIYELYFPDDLHAINVRLFEEVERAGIAELRDQRGEALDRELSTIARLIFRNDHPIYRMLFDLQGLEIVRIIEGKV